MKILSSFTCLGLALAGQLFAAQPDKPYQGSPPFERMKSLVGTWKGKTDMGQGPIDMTVEYRLVAGGSAIEERFFAGTPMEMITMYHEKQGKLALTHYCMLHNQPSMNLKSSNDKTLTFDLDPACGIDAKSEPHMHSLVITFNDADTITHNWNLFESGKAKENHPFTLKRAKS
jgi:hypothetical protein